MIIDLFAGSGGWSEGLRLLGLADVGIEIDAAACATRVAAGHLTIRADVETYPPERFAGAEGVIASPPCQDFSQAGDGAGRAGKTGHLIDTVPAWVAAIRPRWVACEQVPPCLPIWREHAHLYRTWGYRTWVGILNAADYGVPQTRRRAFLLASLDGPVHPPSPTHCRGGGHTLLGALQPWVSMADALGWPEAWEAHRLRGAGMTGRHGERRDHPLSEPAPTVLSNGGSNASPGFIVRTGANSMVTGRTGSRAGDGDVQPYERPISEPAPTLDQKVGQWALERPATTIAGDARCWPPGHKVNGDDRRRLGIDEADERYGDRAGTEAIRLELADALILQSFRPDYPVQGTKTKQFEQVGNAVPPLLAAHIVAAVTGRALETAA